MAAIGTYYKHCLESVCMYACAFVCVCVWHSTLKQDIAIYVLHIDKSHYIIRCMAYGNVHNILSLLSVILMQASAVS